MFRIRFHGRGGQGVKTAGRILGSALFAAGYEVQDAPRYGAERRGAPLFAYVRAARAPIHERGVIRVPDLVVVADDSLVAMPAAGVLQGLAARTVLLVVSDVAAETWRARLARRGPLFVLPASGAEQEDAQQAAMRCSGAAACLLGVVPRAALATALQAELAGLAEAARARSQAAALAGYDALLPDRGCVAEGGGFAVADHPPCDWVELPLDPPAVAAAAIHGGANSAAVRTGLWRTQRPVADLARCKHCWWVCSAFCPDSAIHVTAAGTPEIDYDHCKGCLICVAQCPAQAIRALPEHAEAAA